MYPFLAKENPFQLECNTYLSKAVFLHSLFESGNTTFLIQVLGLFSQIVFLKGVIRSFARGKGYTSDVMHL